MYVNCMLERGVSLCVCWGRGLTVCVRVPLFIMVSCVCWNQAAFYTT